MGAPVGLDDDVAAVLENDLDALFAACHRYADVVGEPLDRGEIERLWQEQQERTHATLLSRGATDGPHASLRDRDFVLLVGLGSPDAIAGPVLTREDGGKLTAYTKCPGLESLLLVCKVSRLIPGMKPGVECDRLERLAGDR